MNSPQSGTRTPSATDTSPAGASHRRGSDVESIGQPPAEQDDAERLHSDEALEEEREQASESIDETDTLSTGGPDSLEDIEQSDEDEDSLP